MSHSPENVPQANLLLRIVGGGYLMYLAWDIRDAFQQGPFFILTAVVFAVVGLVLAGHSLRTLLTHEYFRKNPAGESDENENREESTNE